jgi:deferrochelatase/peroxidase EfeB
VTNQQSEPGSEPGAAGVPAEPAAPAGQAAGGQAAGGQAATRPAGPAGDEVSGQPAQPQRRSFLRGVIGAGVAGVAVGGAAGYGLHSPRSTPAMTVQDVALQNGRMPAVPFHGEHQAGILREPAAQTSMISFDVTAQNRAELTGLMRTITDRAAFLTAGGTPPPVGITQPPSDSGILGPTIIPDGLTFCVGVGASLFDDRFGLSSQRPGKLTTMVTFPDDRLDQAQCHGDLSVQLTAANADTVVHAIRDLAKHTRGAMQIRWRMDGFLSPARPAGTTPRNLMGFMDGIANPAVTSATQMKQLVWVQPNTQGEPAWTAGGSYLAVRLIRMLAEFWDRVAITEQENMFGRRRDSGAPLDGSSEHDTPNYSLDPGGDVIPLTAHIRLANPRTPQTAESRILRRAHNYDLGIDDVGNLNQGLIFTCYQQDIKRQFEAVQTRLIGEPLVDYISPFGGGYFFALPGVRDSRDYLGRGMLA